MNHALKGALKCIFTTIVHVFSNYGSLFTALIVPSAGRGCYVVRCALHLDGLLQFTMYGTAHCRSCPGIIPGTHHKVPVPPAQETTKCLKSHFWWKITTQAYINAPTNEVQFGQLHFVPNHSHKNATYTHHLMNVAFKWCLTSIYTGVKNTNSMFDMANYQIMQWIMRIKRQ